MYAAEIMNNAGGADDYAAFVHNDATSGGNGLLIEANQSANNRFILKGLFGATTRFVFTTSGNVGIGETSPASMLDIADRIEGDSLVINEFSRFGGFTAPAIKMAKITGKTSTIEGADSTAAHGLTSANIISISCIVKTTGSIGYAPGNDLTDTGVEYQIAFNSTNVIVSNHTTNSESILNKDFIFTIFYEE